MTDSFSMNAETYDWSEPRRAGAGPNIGAVQPAVADPNTNGLMTGSRWANLGLTYSFPTLGTQYPADYGPEPTTNFAAASAALQTATRAAFALVSQYTNLVFTEVNPATTTADIMSAISTANNNNTAYAYQPGDAPNSGDVWYGTAAPEYQNPVVGQYSFTTVMHELGHTLGLKHGHEAEGAFPTMQPAFDQMAYSLMSYRSYVGANPNTGATNEQNGYPETYMMYDIAALQAMYGANFNTNAGATVYRWDANTGEMFINNVGQGAPGGNRIFMTIWDGNGVDTYDFSNYTSNLNINLAPGAFSITSAVQIANVGDGNFAPGNIFNALQFNGDARSLIENAIGGSGADRIVGNAAANTFSGGAGGDALDGGAGVDAVTFAGAAAGVTANLDLGIGAGGDAQGDTYANIENLIGSAFNDVLVGKPGAANILDGGAGADTLYGEGLDTFLGGAGLDTLFATAGAALNVNLAATGLETVWGGFLSDTLNASAATVNVVLVGQGPTADTMTGGAGNDFIYFRAGDVIAGGTGNDWAVATLSATGVALNMTGNGFENAWGSTSADAITAAGAITTVVLVGDAGADALGGGTAGDFLYGLGDNDALNGGGGNDNLVGGGGTDTFRFDANWGVDIVWDWENGTEKFNLNGSGATSFAQLTVNQNLGGSGNALIAFGANQILVVGGASLIDATDFVF